MALPNLWEDTVPKKLNLIKSPTDKRDFTIQVNTRTAQNDSV